MKWITRLRLVDDVQHAWKWASVRVALASGALLSAWEAMPTSIRDRLPAWLPAALAVLIVVSRLTTLKAAEGQNGSN